MTGRKAAACVTVALAGALAAPAAGGGTTLAHEGAPPAPHDLPGAWAPDPAALAALAAAGILYTAGLRRLRRRGGPPAWRAAAFAAGLGAVAAALLSPLDGLSAALFSAHMVQHLLLILAAAPLLVLARPQVAWLVALPRGVRRWLGRRARADAGRAAWHALSHPAVAWGLHATAVWAWHLPGPYQAALRHDAVHALEHAALLGTALLFWWPLLGARGRRRLDGGGAFLYLLAASLQGGALGALMTLAPAPWYPAYAGTAAAWGLTPLQDQQLAGLLMWVPAGLWYGLAAGAVLVAWLGRWEGDEPEERRYALLPPGGGRPPSAPLSGAPAPGAARRPGSRGAGGQRHLPRSPGTTARRPAP
ncbi:MAG TPA: cytochrome c oxidase assembly protein [Dehalococcoidia bacterium]